MELHKDVNEIESEVLNVDESKGIMTIKMNQFEINTPLNRNYKVHSAIPLSDVLHPCHKIYV